MNKRIAAAISGILLATACLMAQESLESMIERGITRAAGQSEILAESMLGNPTALPRTWEDGELKLTSYSGWVSGFFPGVLWMLYEQTGQEKFLEYAKEFTSRVEPAKKLTNTHDLGFMLMSSFGQGYRITGDPHYLEVIHEGTDSLMTRWDHKIGVMKSWNENSRWKYPVIIDNMMNLEMLCFCAQTFSERGYELAAITHAYTTIQNHFRADNSTWHVVSYDPATGQPHAKNTAQGYSDDSAWARGQAWGLYGYTMMYRETLDKNFLEQARKIGRFIMNHPNLPEDKVPCWDFNAPGAPGTALRDASAAAIMASAFIELSQLDPGNESAAWLDLAIRQLRTLSSPEYLAAPGEQGGFIIKHGVGHFPAKAEVDVPLTYGDYYYLEALIRLKKLLERSDGATDRKAWVDALVKTASPVIENLAAGTLKKNMPYETLNSNPYHRSVSYLEAVGRTVCGIAPWLELGADDTEEGRLRARFIDLTVKGLKNAVDPSSPDYLVFGGEHGGQPLVDAAFLAEGLLRAPSIWKKLDRKTRDRFIKEWKRSREIKAPESNWLLFASTVEAAILEFAGEYDPERLLYGVKRFRDNWYKGDGWYGDGNDMHLDYYNSLVIHPMLTEVLCIMRKHGIDDGGFLEVQAKRHARFAAELERMVSPEGTYPVIGRSITYRFGSFHALADAALLHILPEDLSPAQVRCALTAVIERQLAAPGTFDPDGWLRVGYAGRQSRMGETYINTGSLYLCCAAFLPLGLPADDPFWSAPARDWTSRKAWNGVDVGADHCI